MSIETKLTPIDVLVALRTHEVDTSEAHVRIAHSNYSATNPELVGELNETASEVSFSLFVPALGETITYRASVYGEAA